MGKRAGIKPVRDGVHLRRAAWAASPLVRVAYFVGTGQAGSIIVQETDTRTAGAEAIVGTIDDKNRETGGDFLNDGYLPVPQESVGRATPTGAEMFALAKGQVVNDAGAEVVVKIQPGQSPIQLIKAR